MNFGRAMKVVPLHTIQTQHLSPRVSVGEVEKRSNLLVVLVHGLDSSSKTWIDTMNKLEVQGISCLAVDQRCCGFSPLGDIREFCQEALIEDLHHTVAKYELHYNERQQETTNSHRKTTKVKLVLLGHSLGGRIVLGYAATYPEQISALIIEDMDIAQRVPEGGAIQIKQEYQVGTFERRRDTKDEIIQSLINDCGYPTSFIQKALDGGRIEQIISTFPSGDSDKDGCSSSDTYWWSHVNPDFRVLCYKHILSTTKAKEDCFTIVRNRREGAKEAKDDEYGGSGTRNFPCHVLVAGDEGTVCFEDSIQEMKQILDQNDDDCGNGTALGPSWCTIHRFPTAGHSIHSSPDAKDDFLQTIISIIDRVL